MLSYREEPVEVARASIPDASWTPSSGGVLGTSHREEAQGTAQDTLEGPCLSAGLGTPWAPPGGAGGGVWGEGRLGVSAESAAPATRTRINGRRRVRIWITLITTSWIPCSCSL
ncbi:hypothetical protein CHARACLAT_000942 [Characodon lateralis]|uniref:Uncharacterized protein n=1 Tax=Characodon lateralis TaxID=208331 RepID=A0ABU7EPV5_9TELE|nr:hypothetical protein [Characodon lateralis]